MKTLFKMVDILDALNQADGQVIRINGETVLQKCGYCEEWFDTDEGQTHTTQELVCSDCANDLFTYHNDTDLEEAFEEYFADFIRGCHTDGPMLREAFNNWTDGLCKEGEISRELYENGNNPY